MPNLNVIQLIGHCGGDPEMKFNQDGVAITTFNLAVNDPKKVNDEWKDNTQWFRITTFRKQAERVNNSVSKGMPLYVSGKLKLNEWDGKDGVRHASLEVTADKVILLSKGKSQGVPPDDIETDEPF